ncbi:hypothetical protein, partial [Pseudomonas coronafaciens]|uniref:hypothetical protein n=1 Tax=Pseudomonas coronafaciens TaxID=53409 RepID=UPI001F43B010
TRPLPSLTPHSEALQPIDLQGFFVSVCAGSGANYRQITEGVNRYFQKPAIRSVNPSKRGRSL